MIHLESSSFAALALDELGECASFAMAIDVVRAVVVWAGSGMRQYLRNCLVERHSVIAKVPVGH